MRAMWSWNVTNFKTSPMFHGSWASWSFICEVAAIASRCLQNDLPQTTHTELFEWLLRSSCKLSNMAAIASRFLQNGTSHEQHILNWLSGFWDVLVYSQTLAAIASRFCKTRFLQHGTSHKHNMANWLSGFWDVLVDSQTWLQLLQGVLRQDLSRMGPLMDNTYRNISVGFEMFLWILKHRCHCFKGF